MPRAPCPRSARSASFNLAHTRMTDPAAGALRADVEAAYRAGELTVAAIAARFEIPEHRIYDWARDGDWPRRRPPSAPTRKSKGKSRSRAAGRNYKRLLARIYAALESTLTRMETDMTEAPPGSPADGERTTRTLQNMIRSVDKLRSMETAQHADTIAAAGAAAVDTREADRLRLELASRLIKLCERRLPDGGDRPDAGGDAAAGAGGAAQ